MSDSLIVAAEGSAPYKLLEDAGRGILSSDALTSALKNGVPAATCDDSSESLLTKCARACDIECVKILLAKSAPVDAVDKRGVPALFVAMEYTAQCNSRHPHWLPQFCLTASRSSAAAARATCGGSRTSTTSRRRRRRSSRPSEEASAAPPPGGRRTC